eukprot:CAMPEP_0185540714 /NCGR_PEP_ID=MMETSP1381-20130426/1474_1 /TAXON_ID=298111 /ORGANISM="Pavlova sp., Strain CCMP459" /LENGTH=102 /DNA_ID=CAMNT_0028152577 /DNA_START=381 /DNA_END=687 /DNA_ORIENTATION=-
MSILMISTGAASWCAGAASSRWRVLTPSVALRDKLWIGSLARDQYTRRHGADLKALTGQDEALGAWPPVRPTSTAADADGASRWVPSSAPLEGETDALPIVQ